MVLESWPEYLARKAAEEPTPAVKRVRHPEDKAVKAEDSEVK